MMKQNWIYKRFDEVFDLQMGKTPDRQNPSYFQGENVWISIRDLGEKYISDSKEKISDKALVDTGIRVVKKGTVIMSFKLTVGKCGIAAKDLYTNEAIMAFNLKDGIQLESSFLYYYLQGYHWQGANKAVMGITLNKATISRHIVGIPPLPLQQSIVAELDNINNLINIKKSQLKDLDNLAQSIFYEMFGDPIENEKGWDVIKLGEVCEKITDGTHDTPQRLDNGIKFITGKHIRPFFVDYENSDYVSEEVHKEIFKRCNPEFGDVLYTNIGAGIGNAAINIVCYEFSMKNVALLKVKKDIINGYYLEYYLNNEKIKERIIENYSNGGAQRFLSLKSIARILSTIPPLPLQQKFAEKIEAIEKHKQIVNVTIKDLETLLASRMQFWFE